MAAASQDRAAWSAGERADCRSRLGYLLSATGKTDDALAVYRQARADQEALADAPGPPPRPASTWRPRST